MMCSSLVSSLLNRDYLQGLPTELQEGIRIQSRDQLKFSSSIINVFPQNYRKAFVFSLEIKPIQAELKYYQVLSRSPHKTEGHLSTRILFGDQFKFNSSIIAASQL